MPDDNSFLTPNRLLAISGMIIFTLIGVLWTFSNNRIQALEEWRKSTDASRAERIVSVRTEIALTKERLQMLTDRVNELKIQVDHVKEELDKRVKK